MSSSIADAFKKLEVDAGASVSEHENAFSVSFEYLLKVSNYSDVKAFKNCLVALINLDRYQRAFEIAKRVPDSAKPDLLLELAYVYYKLGKPTLVSELYTHAESLPEGDGVKVGMQHIMAQTWYKNGDYTHALEGYHQIIASTKYDSREDLAVNERAIVSQLNSLPLRAKISSKYSVDEFPNNYDLLFNEALVELSRGFAASAVSLLARARDMCISQNSDAPESDLLAELAPIQLTLAYVSLKDGSADEYLALTDTINDKLIDDVVTKLIIKNNWYAMQPERASGNLNLVARDLHYMHSLHLFAQKLTRLQYQQIFKNSVALRYATGTLGPDQVSRRFSAQFASEFAGDLVPLVYKTLLKLDIVSEQLQDPLQYGPISRKLFQHAKLAPSQDDKIAATMLLVSFNHTCGCFDQSLVILKHMFAESVAAREKIVAAVFGCLYKICILVNKPGRARDVLADALDLLLEQRVLLLHDVAYYNFAKHVAFESYNACGSADACEKPQALFSLLAEIDPTDVVIQAVCRQSVAGLMSVEELAGPSCGPLDDLLKETVESVESTAATRRARQYVPRSQPRVAKPKRTRPAKFSATKVMKPAHDVIVDPERWLPLKLRSYYKPTKKDRRKASTHQGAMEPVPAKAPAPHASTSGSSSKKKKKKGKK